MTVSSAEISGAGFTMVGGSVPVTLNPTHSMTLQVQFAPTATGTACGQLTICSDSSTGSSAVVALSGTSKAALTPQLAVSAASLKLWKPDSELSYDAIADLDVDGYRSSDSELRYDHGGLALRSSGVVCWRP